MNNPRACRHCGSPAKGNPCWWSMKNPERANQDEPPCMDDFDIEQYKARERRRHKLFHGFLIAAAIIFLLAVSFCTMR